MNLTGYVVISWCVATFIGLFIQLIPGMPRIGFGLFIFGGIPASIALFFIEFKDPT